MDSVNTVLDANGTGSALVLSTPDTNANLEVDGLTLQNGVAENEYGGGIYTNTNGGIIVSNSTIRGNEAEYGGGFCMNNPSRGSLTLINTIIIGNTSNVWGGGIYANTYGDITIVNTTIVENTTSYYGGGIFAFINADITLINNTISINKAGEYTQANDGGGICLKFYADDAVANIINNIILNNTTGGLGNDLFLENDADGDYFPSTVNLFNNDFDQSAAGTYIQLPFTIDSSNLDNEDPLFADAVSGNYHITASSPCVDAGRLEGAPSDDMDGDSRPIGDGVDIGADEFDPSAPPTTTTSTPTTSSSSTTTSIEPTTSTSSSTTSSIPQPPPATTTTSVETTTSSSISSTTTAEPTTTTTSILADCMLSISISPPQGGTTSPPPPQYFVMGCHPVTVEALPNLGYTFSHWEGAAQGSDNPITIEIAGTLSITAVFVLDICPIEGLYGEDSDEVEILRYVRDNVLSKTTEGQELIRLYYQWSPVVVRAMEADEECKEEVKEMINEVLSLME